MTTGGCPPTSNSHFGNFSHEKKPKNNDMTGYILYIVCISKSIWHIVSSDMILAPISVIPSSKAAK
jgi:hypothetical protein